MRWARRVVLAWVALLAFALAVSAREARAAGPRDDGVGLPMEALRDGHPGDPARTYHNLRHSLSVQSWATEFARRRGLPEDQQRFVSQVAQLHDWDPHRTPGTPARVPATLAALEADFAGTEPLVKGYEGSYLRGALGWDRGKLDMARAMIQRTEFPFGATHPSPAYAGTSPVARYEQMLSKLPTEQRRFVMQEGALLSEYADKMSTYATRSFGGTRRAVDGLAHEINTTAGAPVTDARKLDTATFLHGLGRRESFSEDHALAQRMGVGRLDLPTRRAALAVMPPSYGRQLRANAAGYKAANQAFAAGATNRDAWKAGAAAAARSLRPR